MFRGLGRIFSPNVVAVQSEFSQKGKFISPFIRGNYTAEVLSRFFLVEKNLASCIGFKVHLGGPDQLVVPKFCHQSIHLKADFFRSLFKSVVCFR